MRILFYIALLVSLGATPSFSTGCEDFSHPVTALSYGGEALSLAQVEAQEHHLRSRAQNGGEVSISDLRAHLGASDFLSAASYLYAWGMQTHNPQEKYARFAQATRYVRAVWPERDALNLPREFIKVPYIASLYAEKEEDMLACFRLWRMWEKDYPGTQAVIGLDTLKRDARLLHGQAQKIYSAKPKEGWSAFSYEPYAYKNLTLKSLTLSQEILDKNPTPTSEDLLECLENHLLARRISVPYERAYNVYAVQVLEKFLILEPPLNPQQHMQAATLSFAVGMLFKSRYDENLDPTDNPEALTEQHLRKAYYFLQKIAHADLLLSPHVTGVASLYAALGQSSCQPAFTQACYVHAATLCEQALEAPLENGPLLGAIIAYYTKAAECVLFLERLSTKENICPQKWVNLFTYTPSILQMNDDAGIIYQHCLYKIKHYNERLRAETMNPF